MPYTLTNETNKEVKDHLQKLLEDLNKRRETLEDLIHNLPAGSKLLYPSMGDEPSCVEFPNGERYWL